MIFLLFLIQVFLQQLHRSHHYMWSYLYSYHSTVNRWRSADGRNSCPRGVRSSDRIYNYTGIAERQRYQKYKMRQWNEICWYLCLVSSADNICNEFGPRSDQTKCRAWSGSKLFDTDSDDIPENIIKKVDFDKISIQQKAWKITINDVVAFILQLQV